MYHESKKTVSQLQKIHFDKIKENMDLDLKIKGIKEQFRETEELYREKLNKLRKKPATKDIEIQVT